ILLCERKLVGAKSVEWGRQSSRLKWGTIGRHVHHYDGRSISPFFGYLRSRLRDGYEATTSR
ncbi:hypothetical protein FOZ63_004587, partial [Perkinsus olseni]